MTKIGGYKPNKEGLLKKAIRKLGGELHLTNNTYYKLSNHQILEYMNDNRMGVQWITLSRIRRMRTLLPAMYRKKHGD